MIKVLFPIIFIVLLVILGPVATIWSLNALFPSLNIVLGFDTWCAALILGAVIRGDGLSFKSK